MKIRALLQRLGPGMLFAGAAVGVSHLVYSTKAGALYGFGLLWVILVANLFKYPFFEYGARYAAARGESLLKGYQRLGNGVLLLFVIVTLATMFTVQAAVTLVTASLGIYLFGGDPNQLLFWVGILLIISAALLWLGRYQALDGLIKMIILALTLLTLWTVGLTFVQQSTTISWQQSIPSSSKELMFLVAFMGWMPAPLDLSVWHSLWALQKRKSLADDSFDLKAALFDFNVGYIGTTILAFFFLALGALVMYDSGVTFSDKANGFAQQLIDLYTTTLGASAGYFVGGAAFITMFSTTITCLDALPRAMGQAHYQLQSQVEEEQEAPKSYYQLWMVVLIIGSLLLLSFLLTNMGAFIQLATILSFLTAPFFAFANYFLVRKELPADQQPSRTMRFLTWLGIAYLFVFCGVYLWQLIT